MNLNHYNGFVKSDIILRNAFSLDIRFCQKFQKSQTFNKNTVETLVLKVLLCGMQLG